jgi:DNA-binding MarR family transcriptional regulator
VIGQGKLTEQDYQRAAEFRRALCDLLRAMDERAAEQGLTPQQYALLLSVRGHPRYPGLCIGDVAAALSLGYGRTSKVVDCCVRKGLVHRMEDPSNRRRSLVWLTDSGQEILDAVIDLFPYQTDNLPSGLTPATEPM